MVFRYAGRRMKQLQAAPQWSGPKPLAPDFWFVLIAVAALVIRFYGIGREALSSMEATYLIEIMPNSSILDVIIHKTGIANSHNPLFRVLFHYIAQIVIDPVAYRMIIATASAFGAAYAYLLGRGLLSRNAGLALGALMALSPFQVHYGRMFLPYAIMVLVALAAACAFIGAAYGLKRYRFYLAALLATGMWLHLIFAFYAAVLFLAGVAISFREKNRPDRWRPLLAVLRSGSLAGMIYIPWFPENLFYQTFMQNAFAHVNEYARFTPVPESYLEATHNYFGHVLVYLLGLPPIPFQYFGLYLAVLLLPAAYIIVRKKRWDVLFIGAAPTLIAFAANMSVMFSHYSSRLLFFDRYYILPHPFLLLMFIAGFYLALPQKKNRMLASAVLGFVLVLYLVNQANQLKEHLAIDDYPRIDEAAAIIKENAQDYDAMVVAPQNFLGDLLMYYLWPDKTDLDHWYDATDSPGWYSLFGKDEPPRIYMVGNLLVPWANSLDRLAYRRIWLVYDQENNLGYWEYDQTRFFELAPVLFHTHKLIESWQVSGVSLWLFETRFEPDFMEGQTLFVRVGIDDLRYLDGFSREQSKAPSRIIQDGMAVMALPDKDVAGVEVRLILQSPPMSHYNFLINASWGDYKQTFRVEADRHITWIKLFLDRGEVGTLAPIRLEFEGVEEEIALSAFIMTGY